MVHDELVANATLLALVDAANDKITQLGKQRDAALRHLSAIRCRIVEQEEVKRGIAHLQSALESAQDDFVAEEHYGD